MVVVMVVGDRGAKASYFLTFSVLLVRMIFPDRFFPIGPTFLKGKF